MNQQIFLQRLQEKIDESGLTLDEISEKTEISVRSLKYYFKNERIPRIPLMLKLHSVLGFEFEYLLQHGKYEL